MFLHSLPPAASTLKFSRLHPPPIALLRGGYPPSHQFLMPRRHHSVSWSPSPLTQLPFPSTWCSTPSVCSALPQLMCHQFLHLLTNQNIVLSALQELLHVTVWCLHPCCAPRICLRCLIMDPDSIDPLEGDLPGDNFLPIEGRFSRLGSSAHSTVCGLQLGQPSWVSSQRQPSSAASSQPPLPPCNFSSTNQYAVAIL